MASIAASPGTMSQENVGGTPWTNEGNATASDNAHATCTVIAAATDALVATNFDFSAIPGDATINGYELKTEWKTDHSSGLTSSIGASLRHNGSDVGDFQDLPSISNVSSDTVRTIGGASNLLGASLTVAQIKDGTFGYRIFFLLASLLRPLSMLDLPTLRHHHLPASVAAIRYRDYLNFHLADSDNADAVPACVHAAGDFARLRSFSNHRLLRILPSVHSAAAG